MIKVVTGAGASGKSSFAESLLEQSEAKRKIYAATMIVWDDECRARVKKHRQMREKKGFETAERPVDLGELFVPEDGAVLVECMSNLAANEMYRSAGKIKLRRAGQRGGILQHRLQCTQSAQGFGKACPVGVGGGAGGFVRRGDGSKQLHQFSFGHFRHPLCFKKCCAACTKRRGRAVPAQ